MEFGLLGHGQRVQGPAFLASPHSSTSVTSWMTLRPIKTEPTDEMAGRANARSNNISTSRTMNGNNEDKHNNGGKRRGEERAQQSDPSATDQQSPDATALRLPRHRHARPFVFASSFVGRFLLGLAQAQMIADRSVVPRATSVCYSTPPKGHAELRNGAASRLAPVNRKHWLRGGRLHECTRDRDRRSVT